MWSHVRKGAQVELMRNIGVRGACRGSEGEVFGEGAGQAAPDAVGVELQRLPDVQGPVMYQRNTH